MNGRNKVNGKENPPNVRGVSAPVPVQARRQSARRKKRGSPLGKLIGLGALAALIAGGVWIGRVMPTLLPGGNMKTWLDIYNHPTLFFPENQRDRITVLLIGKDYQYDKNYQRYTGTASRADSIMLLTLDFKTRHLSSLSIPRDTRVRISGKTGKINATLSAETYPGKGGPALLCSSVESVTGIKPDYYVAIKPDAVGNLVQELGGVDVETIDAFEYNDFKAGLHVKLPKGQVHISTPEDAIGYCRYREIDTFVRNADGSGIYLGKNSLGLPMFKQKSATERAELNKCLENGDTRRMVRQQNMIRAMIASGKRQLVHADRIVNTAFKQFDTNLKHDQLLAIASLYRNAQPDQVASGTLPGEFEKHKPFFFIPDRRKTEAIVQWLVNGDEKAANQVTRVAVQNATAISGVARRVAELLRARGNFDADYVREPLETPATTTTIQFTKALNKPRAEMIAKLLGGGIVQKDMAPDTTGSLKEARADITVTLGSDLAARLGEQSARR